MNPILKPQTHDVELEHERTPQMPPLMMSDNETPKKKKGLGTIRGSKSLLRSNTKLLQANGFLSYANPPKIRPPFGGYKKKKKSRQDSLIPNSVSYAAEV